MHTYYVYIMASHTKVLYVGVTNDLEYRVTQHREKVHPRSFTARYNVDRLAYDEDYPSIRDAIEREKQIKTWVRKKKITLIESANPHWVDLSYAWRRPRAD